MLSGYIKEIEKNFSEKHYKKCKSGIMYMVYPTGIGNTIYIKCRKCKKEKNITDYRCW